MRAIWNEHENIAGPASTLLMIHDQFRVAAERMLLLIDREPDIGWVARAFAPLAQTLHHHHHAEEVMLFPMVLRRTGVAPDDLVDDHQTLTDAIAAVETALSPRADGAREAGKQALTAFREVLVTHLDREEALVIPILLAMTPAEAWSSIHSR